MGKRREIYVSTDVEADGPLPGVHSMLSIGSVALTLDKENRGTFEANLETLPEATADPDTMRWWTQFPEAWAATRRAPEAPVAAMGRYLAWLEGFEQQGWTPVFVAYPAGFDFMYVFWYLKRFAGRSPFSFSAVDIKTFAWAMRGGSYRDTTKTRWPKRWFEPGLAHTHVALDDAMEQGCLFINMLREHRGLPPVVLTQPGPPTEG
ncbi:MAG: exonuclease [Myxococcota bacterium]